MLLLVLVLLLLLLNRRHAARKRWRPCESIMVLMVVLVWTRYGKCSLRVFRFVLHRML
jgi:uncharacterized membrane protein YsdA (DUF1294 family)